MWMISYIQLKLDYMYSHTIYVPKGAASFYIFQIQCTKINWRVQL